MSDTPPTYLAPRRNNKLISISLHQIKPNQLPALLRRIRKKMSMTLDIASTPIPPEPPTLTLCHSLEHPSWANFSFSLLILIGILGSYLPQHYRIISRKTSEGISPFFLFLGATSSTAAFLNILILSKDVLGCCKYISGFNCFAAGLGVAQVGAQLVCFAVV